MQSSAATNSMQPLLSSAGVLSLVLALEYVTNENVFSNTFYMGGTVGPIASQISYANAHVRNVTLALCSRVGEIPRFFECRPSNPLNG